MLSQSPCSTDSPNRYLDPCDRAIPTPCHCLSMANDRINWNRIFPTFAGVGKMRKPVATVSRLLRLPCWINWPFQHLEAVMLRVLAFRKLRCKQCAKNEDCKINTIQSNGANFPSPHNFKEVNEITQSCRSNLWKERCKIVVHFSWAPSRGRGFFQGKKRGRLFEHTSNKIPDPLHLILKQRWRKSTLTFTLTDFQNQ